MVAYFGNVIISHGTAENEETNLWRARKASERIRSHQRNATTVFCLFRRPFQPYVFGTRFSCFNLMSFCISIIFMFYCCCLFLLFSAFKIGVGMHMYEHKCVRDIRHLSIWQLLNEINYPQFREKCIKMHADCGRSFHLICVKCTNISQRYDEFFFSKSKESSQIQTIMYNARRKWKHTICKYFLNKINYKRGWQVLFSCKRKHKYVNFVNTGDSNTAHIRSRN